MYIFCIYYVQCTDNSIYGIMGPSAFRNGFDANSTNKIAQIVTTLTVDM